MSGFHNDSLPTSRLLGHSLKLALAVVVTGLIVVFLVDREEGSVAPLALSRDLAPARDRAVAGPTSELALKAGSRGHFVVEAEINGETLRFLVDTGASSIYLTPDDAAQLGWTPQRLTYSERYQAAGGEIRAAPITLRTLRIGQLELYDLPASVGESPGAISLLGMTFLKSLESYEVRGDTLILSW